MIYPNGCIDLNRLTKMVESPEYLVFAEKVEKEPEGWDFVKQGFYRGERVRLTNLKDLEKYTFDPSYTICYDFTDDYYKQNPYQGESKTYVQPTFCFKYSGDRPIAIKETPTVYKVKDENTKVNTLEVLIYDKDFGGSCFVAAYWTLDDEGFEFKSVGSRLFDYISDKDMQVLLPALKEADKFLKERFNQLPD